MCHRLFKTLVKAFAVTALLGNFCPVAPQTGASQKWILGFDGNDVAAAPASPFLNLGNEFTIETWIFQKTMPNTGVFIIGKATADNSNPNFHYALNFGNQGRVAFVQSTGVAGTLTSAVSPAAIPLNQWVHIAGSLSGGTMRLFVNGQQVASSSSPGAPAGSDVRFGVGGDVRECTFGDVTSCGMLRNGYLRQVRVWNRALTAAEIAARMNLKLSPNETSLAAQWMLEDGSGYVASDSGPNGLNLTLGMQSVWVPNTPIWARASVIERGPFFVGEPFRTLLVPFNRGPAGQLIDVNQDGDLDVVDFRVGYLVQASAVALQNNGSGIFTDGTSTILGTQNILTVQPQQRLVADFNGDGLKDIFTVDAGPDDVTTGGQSRILIQSAGQMIDETNSRLPIQNQYSRNACTADIDGDNDLDIYVSNRILPVNRGPQLYINDGTGHFTINTSRLPTFVAAGPLYYDACSFLDVNNDGRPDLYLGYGNNDGSSDRDTVLFNSVSGNFTQAPAGTLPLRGGNSSFGTIRSTTADLNSDGYGDLILALTYTSTLGRIQILLNNGNGTFRDGTAGLDHQPVQSAPNPLTGANDLNFIFTADFNKDGRIDLVTSPSRNRPTLYLNQGQARFVDYTELLPLDFVLLGNWGQLMLPGDLDGDGDTDIFGDGINDYFMVMRNLKPFSVTPPPADFDGDGKTDISIFRPLVGEWWYSKSSDGQVRAGQFGAATDVITPGDFTGDGKVDFAFFRPSGGLWYILRSEDESFFSFPFGSNGDLPVPADYDGDGRTDAAVFRPSQGTWYISQSSGAGTAIIPFGANGDQPVTSDYDGDGRADIGIVRDNLQSGNKEWWIQRSARGILIINFGIPGDKTVPGDYTGDGKSDIAFFRPFNGEWFIFRSEDFSYFSFPWGTAGDVPVPGDYDGDGKFDASVYRPSAATWFSNRTAGQGPLIVGFGLPTDTPVPSAFVR